MGSGSLLLVSVSSRPVSAAHLIIPYTLMIKASEKKASVFHQDGIKACDRSFNKPSHVFEVHNPHRL